MLRFLRRAALSKLHALRLLNLARRLAIPEPLYKHLAFTGVIEIPIAPGKSVLMNHGGYALENELYWSGYSGGYEPRSQAIWARLAKTAGYIVDVGANTGIYTLAAAAMNPVTTILALEPVARTFSQLKANLALNSFSAQCFCEAASDRDGTAIIHDVESEHQYSASLNSLMLGEKAWRVATRYDKLANNFLSAV